MDIRNRRQLKAEARRSLAMAPCDPRMLVLIHTGVTIILSLLVTTLDFVLENQIGNTGGLGGMGTRSVLETIQSVLRIAEYVLLPFWEFGYTFTVLRLSRVREARPESLLEGFRRFGPVIRITLLETLLYAGLAFVLFYVATNIFMFTPWAEPLYEAMDSLTGGSALLNQEIILDDAAYGALADAYIPIFIIFGILFLPVGMPIYYGLRFSGLCLMDDSKKGALRAMAESRAMLKGHRLQLFRLDLSFWWYYLLHAVLMVICYGDLILPLVGIELPWSGTVSFFIFYILSMLCQLVLYVLVKNPVEVTYALAYDSLRQPPEQPRQNNPWN